MNAILPTLVALALLASTFPLAAAPEAEAEVDVEVRFNRPDPKEGKGFVIGVNEENKIMLADVEFTLDQLAAILQVLLECDEDAKVTIAAHPDSRHLVVANLMRVATRAGVKSGRLLVRVRRPKEAKKEEPKEESDAK